MSGGRPVRAHIALERFRLRGGHDPVLGLVIIGIAAIARSFLERRSWRPQPCERTALDILQERYARAEIDREEYEQKRHDLQL